MANADIKPTSEDDIPALRDVLNETGLFPGEMLAEMLAPSINGEADALWLTCHQGGKAVGFCYTVPEEFADGTWNMLALAVHPAFQGKRLGAALVQAAEQVLSERKQRILIVDTSGTGAFAGARNFYAQNGYDEEARIRDFWADGDDKVTFRKAL